MNHPESHRPAHHRTTRAILASAVRTTTLTIAPMAAGLLALVLTRAAGGIWPTAALNALNATLATAGLLNPPHRYNHNPVHLPPATPHRRRSRAARNPNPAIREDDSIREGDSDDEGVGGDGYAT